MARQSCAASPPWPEELLPVKLDALLLLQQSDIAAFRRQSSEFAGLKLIFLDPGLAEEAMRQGLDPADFEYRPINVRRHFQARAATEAMHRAMSIEHSLCDERSRLFGDGLHAGWDHVRLRFFFLRALVARHLGELCESHFPERAVGMLRPRKPQQFYFDFPWIAEQAQAGRLHALVHIPTVYAHLQHYADQIKKQYPSLTELPSPFWDIPLTSERRPLIPIHSLAPEWRDHRCTAYRERVAAVLDSALLDLLPQPDSRRRQVALMADQSYLQATNYFGLMRALKGTRPHFITTEHDTGAVGPLFSVAEQLGSAVTVVPHSSYPTQPLPHSVNVTAIERDGFCSSLRSVWGAPIRMRPVRLTHRPPARTRPKVQTVCLLLNTLSSRGISYIDLVGLANFHKGLSKLCQGHGLKLLVRLKPGAACLPVAAGALEMPPQSLQAMMDAPIAALAEAADVCVCYGELTSGAIEFLEHSSYVLHVSEELRPNDLLNSSNLSTMQSLISLSGHEALARMERLVSEPGYYHEHLDHQCSEFSTRLTAKDGSLFED